MKRGEQIERAETAWVEVREDGVAMLCYDTDNGPTEVVELSPQAAAEMRREFIEGPTVRHDTDINLEAEGDDENL